MSFIVLYAEDEELALEGNYGSHDLSPFTDLGRSCLELSVGVESEKGQGARRQPVSQRVTNSQAGIGGGGFGYFRLLEEKLMILNRPMASYLQSVLDLERNYCALG